MEEKAKRGMEESGGMRKWVVLAVVGSLLFSATLLFANLGKRDLWNPDEPRYSEIAREMVLDRTLLVPHLNGQVYTQKPPFFFWLVAGSYKIFHRIDEFTARFPIALSAVLGILLIFLIGRRLFDPLTGFFSALVLATTSEYFWLANRVNLDTVMTLFILASVYMVVRAMEEERHRTLYFRLAFFFSGVATITKGPLGIIVPFLTLIVYLLVEGEFQVLKKVPWLSGVGIFVLVLVAGLAPTCLAGGKAYTHELIFRQTVTRYVHGINHKKGFWFYFYGFPETLLPWTFFLPGAVWFALRRRSEKHFWKPFMFVVVWIVANILFLSFSGSKRQLYALSLVPAGGLVVGVYLSGLWRGEVEWNRWYQVPVYALGIVSVLGGLLAPFVPYLIHSRFPDLKIPLFPFLLLGGMGIGTGVILGVLTYKKRFKYGVVLIFLAFYAVFFLGTRWILPMFDTVKSPRALGEKVQALMDEGYDLRTYGWLQHAGILFYTRRTHIPVVPADPNEMAFLQRSPKAALLLRKRQVKEAASMVPVPLEVMWEGRVGHRRFLILRPSR